MELSTSPIETLKHALQVVQDQLMELPAHDGNDKRSLVTILAEHTIKTAPIIKENYAIGTVLAKKLEEPETEAINQRLTKLAEVQEDDGSRLRLLSREQLRELSLSA